MKAAFLAASLVLAASLAAGPAAASGSAQLRVAATVLPRATLAAVRQVGTVTVTARDIERGFVEVSSATQFELTSNTPSQLEVAAGADWFRTARVTGLPAAALEVTPMARAVALLPAYISRFAANLSIRFELAPGAKVGTYPWPLALSVTPG